MTISVNDLDLDYIEFKRSRFNLFGSPHSIKALKNISFTTYRGDIVAIIGKRRWKIDLAEHPFWEIEAVGLDRR